MDNERSEDQTDSDESPVIPEAVDGTGVSPAEGQSLSSMTGPLEPAQDEVPPQASSDLLGKANTLHVGKLFPSAGLLTGLTANIIGSGSFARLADQIQQSATANIIGSSSFALGSRLIVNNWARWWISFVAVCGRRSASFLTMPCCGGVRPSRRSAGRDASMLHCDCG